MAQPKVRFGAIDNRRACKALTIITMLVSLALGGIQLCGQTTRGSVLGRVTDPSGAAVANAQIQLTNQRTATTQQGTTNDAGEYTFANIEPGVYQIQVTATGFSSAIFNSLNLDIQQTLRQDVVLQVGTINAHVTVTATPPLIQTDNPAIQSVVDGQQIQDTPLNGRSNIYGLLTLAPGVQRANSNALVSGSDFQGGTTSTVDGITNNDVFNARMAGPIPSLEDIAEFNVIGNTPPAEFGRGGAQVVILTKSGSNQFHGSLFEFNRNRYFTARSFFQPVSLPLPPYNRNEFGGAVGGPILRNKLFFFFSYEMLRSITTANVVAVMPPPAFLSGNFQPYESVSGKPTIIYNPATGQPFENNTIPQSMISPTSAKFIQYYSNPNVVTANGLGNNFSYNSPTYEIDPRYTIRGDYQLTPMDHLMVRYYQNYDGPYLASGGGTDKFGNYSGTGTLTNNATANYTRVFTSSMVNEIAFGYNREQDPRYDQNRNINPASLVPGLAAPPDGFGGLPTIAINGLISISGPSSHDYANKQHIYQLNDNLSYNHGHHSMKYGAQVLTQRAGQGSVTIGSFSFDGRYTGHYASNGFASGQAINPVNAFADFLLGYMETDATGLSYRYDTAAKTFALYGEDSWLLTPNLTLNFGLRYDKTFVFNRSIGGISNFYPQLNQLVVVEGTPNPAVAALYPTVSGASVGINTSNFLHMPNLNFGPRLGFAYRPVGKENMVVRGGFALVYNYFGSILNGTAGQPPFLTSYTYTAPGGSTPVLSFNNPFPTNLASAPANPSLTAIERNLSTPYNEQWNLTFEDEFMPSTAFRVSYVGNLGRHLYIPFDLNTPPPSPLASGESQQSVRPYQPWGTIGLSEFNTNTNIHQLQVGVRRRFKDLSFDLEYQLTKALGIDGANDGAPTDNRSTTYDYGNLDFYTRNYITFNYSYNLPFGTGKMLASSAGPVMNRVIGGWRLAGIWVAYSGQPFSVNFTSTVANWPSNRASVVPGVSRYPQTKRYTQWFNPAAFAVPAPYTFGAQERNDLFGPGFSDWDGALLKETRITERVNFELRIESFNTLNRTNFGSPVNNISTTTTVGTITSTANNPRELQFGGRITF